MNRQGMTTAGFDIVMLALPRWDGQYSSAAYSLAKELSTFTRVFYVDNPFTWKDFILNGGSAQVRRRRSALLHGKDPFSVPDPKFPGLVAVTPPLVYPANWLFPGKLYQALARLNDRIIYRVFEKIFAEFGVNKFIFINSFNPLYGNYFPPTFSPLLKVYHCVDDIRNSEYVSRHGSYLEPAVVRKSDLTLVTSKELERLKAAESASTYYFPNAADVDLFRQALNNDIERPEELRSIPKTSRIILYMGNICQRIDYELLVKIAQSPDYSLVMIGPRTNDSYRRAGLDKMPNVIFTGKKDLTQLPAYLKFADCCIIPFLCIPLTRSIYPLKINEYLSAGKPVVTTDFSEDIANFGEVALVSRTHDDFIANISKAIQTDSSEKRDQRIGYSAANNWKNRAAHAMNLFKLKLS